MAILIRRLMIVIELLAIMSLMLESSIRATIFFKLVLLRRYFVLASITMSIITLREISIKSFTIKRPKNNKHSSFHLRSQF